MEKTTFEVVRSDIEHFSVNGIDYLKAIKRVFVLQD